MSPLAERFARNLWRSRRRAGLTQGEAAEIAGMSRTALGALEQGRRLPRGDTILRLAAATGVSPCVLMAGLRWQPGYHVDGDFSVDPPAPLLLLRKGGDAP